MQKLLQWVNIWFCIASLLICKIIRTLGEDVASILNMLYLSK
jgi:hypothetical protein